MTQTTPLGRLIDAAIEGGKTQKQIADDLELSPAIISQLRSGKRVTNRPDTLKRFARYFGIPDWRTLLPKGDGAEGDGPPTLELP